MAFLLIVLAALFPAWAGAWEEDQVVDFILAYSPILQAQRGVTQTYTPSTKFSDKLYENTQVYAQVGAGGTEYQPGALTTFAGVRVSIPLASPKEEREHAEKLLRETEKIDEVRGQVLTDITQLRQYEANLAAAENRELPVGLRDAVWCSWVRFFPGILILLGGTKGDRTITPSRTRARGLSRTI